MHWIKEIAYGLIEHSKTNDVYELCDILEINLIETNIEQDSFFYRDLKGNEFIYVKTTLPHPLKNKCIAHELGHALLHLGLDVKYCCNKLTNTGKLEKEANRFATELLAYDLDLNEYKASCISAKYIAHDTDLDEEVVINKIEEKGSGA